MCLCCFFQAEDGIRDYKVTGVQTCALPILANLRQTRRNVRTAPRRRGTDRSLQILKRANRDNRAKVNNPARSEERRVGKEGRAGRAAGRGEGNEESRIEAASSARRREERTQ